MVELSLPVVSGWLKVYLNRVSSQVREDGKEGLFNIHSFLIDKVGHLRYN